MTRCRIEATNRAIFAMIAAVTVRLFGSTIASETGSGLMLQSDSVVRAEQTTISTRGGRGVMANDRAILQVSGTSIERCGGDGIRVGSGSIVWMDREQPVEIRGNAGHGLAMGPRSMATLRGTVIMANRGWGIQAPAGQLTVSGSVNAINRYGPLDSNGSPILNGSWVATPPASSTVEHPALDDTGSTDTVASGPVEPVEPVASDDEPHHDEGLAAVTLPEPEASRDLAPAAADPDLIAGTDGPAIAKPMPEPHPSRARADDLLLRLTMLDGIKTVRLRDPRFRWLIRHLPSSAGLTPLLVDALESVVTSPIVPERTVDLLDQLLDYVTWLASLTLEAELQSIVAPLTRDTMAPAILARLGWEGSPPVTLQEAGDIAHVTRERIRQVHLRLEQVLGDGAVWAPTLDRALAALVAIAPVSTVMAGARLFASGLTGQTTFAIEGIVEAQRLLARATGLSVVERHGFEIVTTGTNDDDATLGDLDAIRIAILKRVNNQGIATLDEIRTHLASGGRDVSTAAIAEVLALVGDYRLVASDHVVPATWDTRNPLWNRLAKMLCLAPGLPVEMAAWQLARDERRSYLATPETLRVFVAAHPELELRDDSIVATVEISEEDVLSDSERTLVALFREHGPVLSFTDLVPLAVGPTFTRVTLALRLASSPVIVKLARNRYRLLTAQDRPSDVLTPELGDPGEVIADSLTDPDADADADGRTGSTFDGALDEDAQAIDAAPETEPEPEPQTAPDPVPMTDSGLPRLVMAAGTEISVRLPDAGVAAVHQVIADLFAERLRWPETTRRQRWSATRLPDLLEAIYHGLPLGPLIVQRQAIAEPEALAPAEQDMPGGSESGSRAGATALVIVDGQQRLAWLARLFNPHYRIPGQPQLAPVRVAFQPDIARFTLAGPDSAADPFLIADIGPLLRGEASSWRVTGDYIARLRTVRSIDETTADRLATAITAVAALRDAHLTIQPVSGRLHPDAIAHLYDRLHRS